MGLLGFGPGSYKAKALVGLGAAGAGLAAERVERMVRLMSHPAARKHVADVLVAAAKRRIPLAANNLIKLDKVVKHVEKQDEKLKTGAGHVSRFCFENNHAYDPFDS